MNWSADDGLGHHKDILQTNNNDKVRKYLAKDTNTVNRTQQSISHLGSVR